MTAVAPPAERRVVSNRLTLSQQARAVWRYRELLVGLVRRELKVKYRGSVLGFAWSLLNPLLTLAVFYVAFDVLLASGIPSFPIYLLTGLLVWNLFSSGVAAATGTVVGNSGLVNKVYFPRLVLPLASVGAAIVHLFLQGIVLVVVLAAVRWDVAWTWMWLVPPAVVTLIVFTAALGILVSAVNVYARDTGHVIELALLAWFWLTPIVYWYELVVDKAGARGLPGWIGLLNPITILVVTFQRVFYNQGVGDGSTSERPGLSGEPVMQILPDEPALWYLTGIGVVALISLVLLVVAVHVFSRLEGNFAEEL